MSRHGRKVATLGPGDAFGELALLDKAPRNATVTAQTPMEVVVLGQREFGGLIDEVPGFARKLLAGMARRLRELGRQVRPVSRVHRGVAVGSPPCAGSCLGRIRSSCSSASSSALGALASGLAPEITGWHDDSRDRA